MRSCEGILPQRSWAACSRGGSSQYR